MISVSPIVIQGSLRRSAKPAQPLPQERKRPVHVLYLVGRVLFALIFIVAAPRHFTAEGIHHAADLGVPLAALCVPLSGLMALAGGLSVASGYRTQWGAWLLIAFLIPVTVMMHGFWRLHDP